MGWYLRAIVCALMIAWSKIANDDRGARDGAKVFTITWNTHGADAGGGGPGEATIVCRNLRPNLRSSAIPAAIRS
jgi:hypothetical protein